MLNASTLVASFRFHVPALHLRICSAGLEGCGRAFVQGHGKNTGTLVLLDKAVASRISNLEISVRVRGPNIGHTRRRIHVCRTSHAPVRHFCAGLSFLKFCGEEVLVGILLLHRVPENSLRTAILGAIWHHDQHKD